MWKRKDEKSRWNACAVTQKLKFYFLFSLHTTAKKERKLVLIVRREDQLKTYPSLCSLSRIYLMETVWKEMYLPPESTIIRFSFSPHLKSKHESKVWETDRLKIEIHCKWNRKLGLWRDVSLCSSHFRYQEMPSLSIITMLIGFKDSYSLTEKPRIPPTLSQMSVEIVLLIRTHWEGLKFYNL